MPISPLIRHNLSAILLYLILLLLPSYLWRFHLLTLPLTLLEVLIIVGFIVLCIEYRGRLSLGSWKYYLLTFATIGAISTVLSGNTMAALGIYKSYIIEPMLVACMILTIKPPLKTILTILSLTITYISVIGIVQAITGYNIPESWNVRGENFRITSVYEYPNAVGLICAPVITLLLAWLIHYRERPLLFFLAGLLGIVNIVLSRSDGAIMAITAAIIVSLYFTRYRWITLAITVLALSIALLLPVTRSILLFQDTSGQVRLVLWQGTMNLLRHHPFKGAGLADFPDQYAQYKLARHTELLLYPHNIFLDFWVELGVLGLIWLIVALVHFFKMVFTDLSKKRYVLLAGMIAILVYGMVDVPYFKNDLAVLFWMILVL